METVLVILLVVSGIFNCCLIWVAWECYDWSQIYKDQYRDAYNLLRSINQEHMDKMTRIRKVLNETKESK